MNIMACAKNSMACHGFIPAPGYSALTCPEGAVFPPEAGVCPRPDFAPDSGDRSVLRLDLPPDLLGRGQDLGLDLAHLGTVIILFFTFLSTSNVKPLPSPNSEMFFISLLINSVMRETPS